jgi:hypothetical protein
MDGTMLQGLLEPDAAHAVKNLLPHEVDGDLSALCVWPDQVRHWYRYRWTSPLHFIDTPDKACSFVYSSRLIHTHFFLHKNKNTTVCVCVFSYLSIARCGVARGLPRSRRRRGHVRRRRHLQLHVPADALQARQRRPEM